MPVNMRTGKMVSRPLFKTCTESSPRYDDEGLEHDMIYCRDCESANIIPMKMNSSLRTASGTHRSMRFRVNEDAHEMQPVL